LFKLGKFQIQAREVDTVPIRLSEPISITIHIIDVNDNHPIFETAVIEANVSANGGERFVAKVIVDQLHKLRHFCWNLGPRHGHRRGKVRPDPLFD